MLVNFRFKNCRSFLRENNLSLEAVKDNELQELNTFHVQNEILLNDENELLKSVLIFGSNASGKTNVIKALAYMKNVLILSASQFPIAASNEHFAFIEEAADEESLYEVELIQNEAYYKYGFTILHGKITGEWLYRRKKRLTPIFVRSSEEIEINGLPKQATKLINIAPHTLFLSVGNNFHLEIAPYLSDVMTWFNNLLIVFGNSANSLDIYTLNNGRYKDAAVKILKLADIGITDFRVIKDKVAKISDINDVLRFNSQLQIDPTNMGQLKKEDNDLYNIDIETYFNTSCNPCCPCNINH